MAKRKKVAARQGAMTLLEQIETLKQEVGPKGVKAAQEILSDHKPSVVKLAFKLLPRSQGSTSLGSRIEALLAVMPPDEAEATRAKLLQAKHSATA